MKKYKVIFISIVLIILSTGIAWADVPTNNALEQMKNLFHSSAQDWSFILSYYAVRLFWILALIDFAWLGIQLALNPGEFSDFFAALIRKVLFIGFFWILLEPVSGGTAGAQARGIQWAQDIVNSLVQAAGQANNWAGGTPTISPSRVFDAGWDLCSQIIDGTSRWSPAKSLSLLIGAIIIMICFGLIAAMMLLMYVQSYIIIYAGVILLGFGGSMFTKDISLMYFRAALATGVKLFVMILVVGLGQTILNQWMASFTVGPEQIILFIGAAIVLLALVKAIPDMVGDLINGFSWGSGQSLLPTAVKTGKTAAATAVGAAAGAVGGAMAVKEAAALAKTQGAKGLVGKTAAVGKNIAKGAVSQSGEKIMQTTTTGRVASQIARKHGLTSQNISNRSNNNSSGSIGPDNN